MFGVYPRGMVRGAPLCVVTEDQRREMVLNGSAKPINNGEAIQLLLTLEQIRGISAQMGPAVTIKAMLGSKVFKAAALSYMAIGLHCPLVLKKA